MNTADNEMAIEKLTLDEEIYVDLLRHFDFLRAYRYNITQLDFYGRDHYLVYSSHRKELFIKWGDEFGVEIRTSSLIRAQRANFVEFALCRGKKTTVAKKRTERLLKVQCVDVSNFAKQHGILLDTGYIFERINNYAAFIRKHANELLG